MATRAVDRSAPGTTKKPKPKAKAPVPVNTGVTGRLQNRASELRSLTPTLPAINRELVGAVSALIALITAWAALAGESNGILVKTVDDALGWLVGRAEYVVPVLAAGLAIMCFRNREGVVIRLSQLAGAFGFAVAATGFTYAATDLAGDADGGFVGKHSYNAINSLVGETATGFVLLAIGVASVLLLTGVGPRELYRELSRVGRIIYKPLPPIEETDLFDLVPPVVDAPKLAVTVIDAPELPRLVINNPKKAPEQKVETSEKVAAVRPRIGDDQLPLPKITSLKYYEQVALDKGELTAKARRIEETLSSFKVEARVREINPGPAVTQFTLEPGLGTKVRRITELQNDLALALAAPSIRIEAPVPGLARVGLEIPNAKVATVGLRETLESDRFVNGKFKLPIPLGRDVNGNYVVGDLTKMPHLLIAGATGSGKSVCLTAIISTFLASKRPNELKMLMMDPKMVELVGYNGVPHLQCPVVTEMDKVVGALRLVLVEMERRYTLFSKMGVRNLDGYRMKVAEEQGAEEIPYLVVIIDELADLMMTAPDDVETVLCRIAQMGRAAGIHLIIATQRPSVDVLTGLIKANVPARIAFAVTSLTDSRVVLDMPGAERLLGRGDMLFLPPDAAKPVRIQGAFIEDDDVHHIVGHWHKVSPIPQFAPEWIDLPSSSIPGEPEDSSDDPLLEQAMAIVKTQGTASASMLQRRLRVGYNRAARLIEQMESDGLIGPADGIKGRQVLDA